jgi:hypothetical protein
MILEQARAGAVEQSQALMTYCLWRGKMSSLRTGETAYRISGGKYEGRLCWTSNERIAEAKKTRRNVEVQLVIENVPSYGTWGGEQVKLRPHWLTEVYTYAVWSDVIPKLKEEIEYLNWQLEEATANQCWGDCDNG